MHSPVALYYRKEIGCLRHCNYYDVDTGSKLSRFPRMREKSIFPIIERPLSRCFLIAENRDRSNLLWDISRETFSSVKIHRDRLIGRVCIKNCSFFLSCMYKGNICAFLSTGNEIAVNYLHADFVHPPASSIIHPSFRGLEVKIFSSRIVITPWVKS